jgi:hypothetical protein
MRTIIHKKGNHACNLYLPKVWFRKPEIVINFEFDSSAEYYHKNGYAGINKLGGVDFSPGTPANKGWSYMIGWSWDTDKIGIYWYVNNPKGDHLSGLLQSLPLIKENNKLMCRGQAKINFEGNKALFSSKNNYTFADGKTTNFCREIRPWFGGIYPAPHDIKIII